MTVFYKYWCVGFEATYRYQSQSSHTHSNLSSSFLFVENWECRGLCSQLWNIRSILAQILEKSLIHVSKQLLSRLYTSDCCYLLFLHSYDFSTAFPSLKLASPLNKLRFVCWGADYGNWTGDDVEIWGHDICQSNMKGHFWHGLRKAMKVSSVTDLRTDSHNWDIPNRKQEWKKKLCHSGMCFCCTVQYNYTSINSRNNLRPLISLK